MTLNVQDVSVTYRNGHTALRQASFSVPAGSIAALVGVNGSGKSTLFKAIMGFVPLSTGQVTLAEMPAKRALKHNIVSYVPQSEEVDWSFPVLVEDVVMMGRYGYMNMLRIPRAEDKCSVDEALARVGMSDYRHRQIGELSGGQKKRVFLARALAQSGQIILLDEPFTGVDVKTEAAIITLCRSCAMKAALCWSPRTISTPSLITATAACWSKTPCWLAAYCMTLSPPPTWRAPLMVRCSSAMPHCCRR